VRFDVLTLFPEMFGGPLQSSILGRAIDAGLIQVHVHNIRDYAEDKHQIVDDYTYGGGPGMVMKPDPIFKAVEGVAARDSTKARVILLTPQGRLLNHNVAGELSQESRLLLVCGHYEGVDERVREHLVEDEISIGDYVLSGGELPAMIVIEAVARRLPGVLGSEASLTEESHAQGLLEYPQYTRPPEFRGWTVPEVLLSGHHAQIAEWRRRQSILRTAKRRPDLLGRAVLNEEERRLAESVVIGKH
jgi:tRNA (guanine37-N1)-methyltransferase